MQVAFRIDCSSWKFAHLLESRFAIVWAAGAVYQRGERDGMKGVSGFVVVQQKIITALLHVLHSYFTKLIATPRFGVVCEFSCCEWVAAKSRKVKRESVSRQYLLFPPTFIYLPIKVLYSMYFASHYTSTVRSCYLHFFYLLWEVLVYSVYYYARTNWRV